MKGLAMLRLNAVGWIEKDAPRCGPLDALVQPLAVAPCTSDVHTVWEGALGDRRDLILGHEAVGEVVEVGSLVRDFKPGDRVTIQDSRDLQLIGRRFLVVEVGRSVHAVQRRFLAQPDPEGV